MADYSLPESFWRDFLSNHWERRPACFQHLFDPGIVSADDLFKVVIGMPSMKTSGDRFWISTQNKPTSRDDFNFLPLDVYGPRHQDQNFEGFFARVRQEHGNCPIGINIHHLEKSSPDLWFRFRDFVSGLNRLTGELPTGRWDIDTFFGTYEATPLGIHKDNASVFAMGVLGNRTYYTWPEEYFQKDNAALSTLDPTVIGPHLEHAVRMDLGPGDVVYWPSSNWHLVVSDGDPSVAVSISAYFGEKLSKVISNQVRHLLATQLKDEDFNNVYKLSEDPADPPPALAAAHHLLAETVRNGQVADTLKQFWLMLRTAEGLHSVSANTNARLIPEDCVSVDPRYAIAWARVSSGGHLVSVNGLAFSVSTTNDAIIIELLKQLNSGQQFTVAQLVTRYAHDGIRAEDITGILTLLHRCRAFHTGN